MIRRCSLDPNTLKYLNPRDVGCRTHRARGIRVVNLFSAQFSVPIPKRSVRGGAHKSQKTAKVLITRPRARLHSQNCTSFDKKDALDILQTLTPVTSQLHTSMRIPNTDKPLSRYAFESAPWPAHAPRSAHR